MASTMLCGDEVNAVVVDIGSQSTRLGFAGQDVPKYNFRSDVRVVGGDKTVGEQAFRVLREDAEAYPITSSPTKWEDMEMLLRYGLEESMRVNPQDHALLFSQNALM
eukprot:gene40662-49576_t